MLVLCPNHFLFAAGGLHGGIGVLLGGHELMTDWMSPAGQVGECEIPAFEAGHESTTRELSRVEYSRAPVA